MSDGPIRIFSIRGKDSWLIFEELGPVERCFVRRYYRILRRGDYAGPLGRAIVRKKSLRLALDLDWSIYVGDK